MVNDRYSTDVVTCEDGMADYSSSLFPALIPQPGPHHGHSITPTFDFGFGLEAFSGQRHMDQHESASSNLSLKRPCCLSFQP